MPSPIVVLPLDVTGLSPANLVEGERHSPLPGTRRLIIPRYGAFFKDNLRVFDPDTDTDLTDDQFTVADLWAEASERSGKAVFNTVIITDLAAPAEIAISYQAYGGPHSRNTAELVNWLIQRRTESAGTHAWEELSDIPDRFKPSDHYHLLAHVYGWERVVAAFEHVREAVEIGSAASWDEALHGINSSLESLRNNAEFVVESLVLDKFNEWKNTLSLFQFGLDLLKNYSLADEYAGQAAGSEFAPPAYEDDRYVNLRGLGYFASSLVERVLQSSTTHLGEGYGQIEDPQRGSIYVARIGTVFTLPAPSVAASIIKQTENMYPTGYPLGDQFVITKIAADSAGTGCFLKGFNPRTGENYIGILMEARCNAALTWHRYYFDGDSLNLKQLVEDHIKANNNPHDVTKEDIKLPNVENLPVVSVDDILSRTATRKLVTLDALLYHMRAHMEGIELVRGDDGLVDLEANPMNDAKIIFAPCKDGAGDGYGPDGEPYLPAGQFISSFCDGTDKYVRWTDGKGGHVDKLAATDSDDCKYINFPKQGEKIAEFCEGYDKKVKYADGQGGSTTEVLKVNDPDCGFTGHPAAGEVIATFCSGVNQMVRYADGHGGYYDMPSMINTYLCGGSIYPTPPDNSGTPDPTATPAPGSVTMEFATSHTTITPGTLETITATMRGAQPNTTYPIEFWHDSTVVGGKYKAGDATITTDAQGTGVYVLQVLDDGTIPRGVYTSWVSCPQFEAISNTVDRTFTGTTSGAASVVYATTHTLITPGTVETITATLTNAAPNTTYNVEYWFTSDAVPEPKTRVGGTGTITTNSQGSGTHSIVTATDDGVSIPRGDYHSWAKIVELNIESTKVTRTYAGGTSGGTPKVVYSTTHTTISPGVTETITATLTGAAPNTTYPIEYWLFSSSIPAPQTRVGGTGSITTNAQGNGSHSIVTAVDDGVSIPRGVYSSWVKIPILGIESTKVDRTYIAGNTPAPTTSPTPAPVNANIVFSTSHTTINPGTVETITATLTNAAPNTTYQIEFWFTSTAVPPPQTRLAGTGTISTNSLGNGTFSVTGTPDDGVSIPRGQYTSWVTCPVLGKTSATVLRSFVGTPAPTPAPVAPSLTFSSNLSTISLGQTETVRVTLNNATPNTAFSVDLWIYSTALPSPQTRKAGNVTVNTNSSGYGIYSWNITDDGLVPRGAYTSWAVCPALNNLASPQVVRTFVGTPAPTAPPYNPKVTYYSSHSSIPVGTTETQYVTLSGMSPNTNYTVQCWFETTADLSKFGLVRDSRGYYSYAGSTLNMRTNASGAASTQFSVYNDGGLPKGTYICWARVVEIGITSTRFNRYFV